MMSNPVAIAVGNSSWLTAWENMPSRDDTTFCFSLLLIFCLSFIATLTSQQRSKPEHSLDSVPVTHVPPTLKTPAKDESVTKRSPPATPSTAESVHRALEPVLYTLPTEKSAAPMHCEPKQAPSGALADKVMRDVKALRAAIEQRKGGWRNEVRAEAEAQLDDFSLARWVIGQFPVPPQDAFEQAMKWRVEHQVAQLYREFHPLARQQPGASERQRCVHGHFYGGIGGVARDGTPYIIERMGKADFQGYCRQRNGTELMKQAYIAHLETLTRCVRATSAEQGRLAMGIVVIDTSGVGPSLVWSGGVAFVQFAAKMGLANFPEGTEEVFLVNAPGIVARLFGIISPLLPADTAKKVKIVSAANTRAALEHRIDRSQIPTFLGGDKSEAELGFPGVRPMPRETPFALP